MIRLKHLIPSLCVGAAILSGPACSRPASTGRPASDSPATGGPAPASIPKKELGGELSAARRAELLKKWCDDTRAEFGKLKWKIDPCGAGEAAIDWKVGGLSVQGRPLLYAEFGSPDAANTTLVFSSVHGDEITPLYLGIELAHWLKANHAQSGGKSRVVIAPMVNPDGFFRTPRTRTNANGVDVNRNFATTDWSEAAIKAWKIKYRSDPRRFPGPVPRSEPETLFQEQLIQLVRPQKILSVHSPLNHFDYDGPSSIALSKFPSDYVQECLKLRRRLKAISTGFFPGSLGNYAGRELGIPTLTLELPSANPRKAEEYWKKFSKGIQTMIEFTMPDLASMGEAKQTGS